MKLPAPQRGCKSKTSAIGRHRRPWGAQPGLPVGILGMRSLYLPLIWLRKTCRSPLLRSRVSLWLRMNSASHQPKNLWIKWLLGMSNRWYLLQRSNHHFIGAFGLILIMVFLTLTSQFALNLVWLWNRNTSFRPPVLPSLGSINR